MLSILHYLRAVQRLVDYNLLYTTEYHTAEDESAFMLVYSRDIKTVFERIGGASICHYNQIRLGSCSLLYNTSLEQNGPERLAKHSLPSSTES